MNTKRIDEKFRIYKESKEDITKSSLSKEYPDLMKWKNPDAILNVIDTIKVFGTPKILSNRIATWDNCSYFYTNLFNIEKAKTEDNVALKISKSYTNMMFPDRNAVYKTITIEDVPIGNISDQFTPKNIHMKVEINMKMAEKYTSFSDTLNYDKFSETLIARGPFIHDCILQFYIAKKWSESPKETLENTQGGYKNLYGGVLRSYRILILTGKEDVNKTLSKLESSLFVEKERKRPSLKNKLKKFEFPSTDKNDIEK